MCLGRISWVMQLASNFLFGWLRCDWVAGLWHSSREVISQQVRSSRSHFGEVNKSIWRDFRLPVKPSNRRTVNVNKLRGKLIKPHTIWRTKWARNQDSHVYLHSLAFYGVCVTNQKRIVQRFLHKTECLHSTEELMPFPISSVKLHVIKPRDNQPHFAIAFEIENVSL